MKNTLKQTPINEEALKRLNVLVKENKRYLAMLTRESRESMATCLYVPVIIPKPPKKSPYKLEAVEQLIKKLQGKHKQSKHDRELLKIVQDERLDILSYKKNFERWADEILEFFKIKYQQAYMREWRKANREQADE